MSNFIKTRNANPKFTTRTLKRNVTSVRRSRANETSRNVRTRHVRHIFTRDDQTNQKLFISRKRFVQCNHSILFMCNQNRTHWIVATINPIFRKPCVHPSTFPKVLIHKFCSSKRREIIIFAHNYFNKQTQTKHLFILIFICIYFSFH